MKLRIDELGRETQFVLVNNLTSPTAQAVFEGMLTEYALGYTRIRATGGWKGVEEAITIYRVASLTVSMRDVLVKYLLERTAMTDLYVVSPTGVAYGYCYEASEPWPHERGQ